MYVLFVFHKLYKNGIFQIKKQDCNNNVTAL
jgi:hypothetical protein